MKRIMATAILIVSAAAGSVTRVSAQEPEVKAKVPFDFVVDNRTLPAGTYRIEPHGDFMLIERLDGNASVYAIANRGETTANRTAELYFHVIGGEHFLSRVASATADTSVVLLPCKMERNAGELRASDNSTEVVHAMAMGR